MTCTQEWKERIAQMVLIKQAVAEADAEGLWEYTMPQAIAASPVDRHLFAMTRKSASKPGAVIWFDGDEVDRFSSFEEFFPAIADYNREEIQALRGSPKN